MRRNLKKALSILLCMILMLGTVAVGGEGFAEVLETFSVKADAANIESGSCGDNVTYTLDKDTGLLTISGTGKMKDYGWGNSPFFERTSIKSVVIENGVTSICNYAFYGCTGLTSITIPDSVTSIGDYAFCGCTGLTSITIPDSVTSFGSSIFYNTGYYNEKDNWENGVLYIGNHLIKANSEIISGSYSIRNGTITIVEYAFSGCTGLTSVTIPNSVTSIGGGVFSDCTGLTSIIVDSGNTVYDSRGNCNAIIKTSINELIAGCQNTIIPNSVTSIGEYAFDRCQGIKSITIPNSVISIGHGAFFGSRGLTSITIPNFVTSIGDSAFNCCYSLKSITIGNSVTSIGDRAFYYCYSLKSITIPNSVTSIGKDAFYNCTGLTSIVIPNSVTSIGKDAFYNCTGLTSIVIPNSVTSIGEDAFYNCTGIKSAGPIGGGYNYEFGWTASIPCYAFSGCTGLTSITIPNSVTSIGDRAFYYCTGLTSITIPKSVTSIGDSAFYYCYSLKSITIGNSVTSIGDDAFKYCSDDMIIFCFTGSTAEKYAEDNGFIFAPLDNNYEISYEWSEDGKTCVATAADKNNKDDVVKENATVTFKVKAPATCEEKGTTTYTAEFTNELFETQTKDIVDIALANHSFTNYVYNNDERVGVDGTETAKCDHCTAIDTRTKVGSAKASPVYAIRNMSKYNGQTIELKSSLTIYADVQNCTDVKWFVTGAKYTPNADGSITINQATTDFSVYFTAKDLDGNTVTSEIETVKVKTGFFAMLVAFFKGLFKALPDLKQ